MGEYAKGAPYGAPFLNPQYLGYEDSSIASSDAIDFLVSFNASSCRFSFAANWARCLRSPSLMSSVILVVIEHILL